MNKQEKSGVSYTDDMKSEIKNMVDGIDADSTIGASGLKMIYGFVKRCFLESKRKSISSVPDVQ